MKNSVFNNQKIKLCKRFIAVHRTSWRTGTGSLKSATKIRAQETRVMDVTEARTPASGRQSPPDKPAEASNGKSATLTGPRGLRLPTKISKAYSDSRDIVGQTHGIINKKTSPGRSKLPVAPDLRKTILLKKAKELENFEGPNCRRQLIETNEELEDASGDSTLVDCEKMEESRDENREENQLVVGKPETHDKSVQTMDIEDAKSKTAIEDCNQSAIQNYYLKLVSIVSFVFLIAACIVFNLIH